MKYITAMEVKRLKRVANKIFEELAGIALTYTFIYFVYTVFVLLANYIELLYYVVSY